MLMELRGSVFRIVELRVSVFVIVERRVSVFVIMGAQSVSIWDHGA